jgi:serine/threonine protein kinase
MPIEIFSNLLKCDFAQKMTSTFYPSKYYVPTFDDYVIGKRLGGGTFANCYLVAHKTDGRQFALKCMKEALNESSQRSFIRELEILAENKHPGALQLIRFNFAGVPAYGDGPAVLTAFLKNGDLYSACHGNRTKAQRPVFDPTVKSKCVFGVAATMAYFHRKGIIHRDLKPENVLLDDKMEPVVVDFGYSRFLDPGRLADTLWIGSPLFMAPELLGYDNDQYSFPVDVFSYGVTLFHFFSIPTALDNDGAIGTSAQAYLHDIRNGLRLKREPEINDYYWSLITRCWSHSPADRPTFHAIVLEFRARHDYVLEGADQALVLEYEEKMMQFLKPDDTQFERELKQMFDSWDERGIAII